MRKVISGTDMRDEWDARAKDDAMYAVVNSRLKGTWTEDEFFKTGEWTVATTVDAYCETVMFDPAGKEALEIGCGVGRLTQALATRLKSVVGVDVSSVMIDTAKDLAERRGVTNVEFYQCNGEGLVHVDEQVKLTTGAFDFAYSCIALQHIPDPAIQVNYLKEAIRVLKPRGHFLIQFYDMEEEYERSLAGWQERREANDILGWSPEALDELPRYETGMRTPAGRDAVIDTLKALPVMWTYDVGKGTEHWWVGGIKRGG